MDNNSRRLFWAIFPKDHDWWRQIWESRIRRLFAVLAPAVFIHTCTCTRVRVVNDKSISQHVRRFRRRVFKCRGIFYRFQQWMAMLMAFIWWTCFRRWRGELDGTAVPIWTTWRWAESTTPICHVTKLHRFVCCPHWHILDNRNEWAPTGWKIQPIKYFISPLFTEKILTFLLESM